MKQNNTREWHNKENLKDLFFMGQRLNELLFDYTLDTYKPSALNSVFLCYEALELIKYIDNEVIDSSNLEYVLEELEWSLSNDIIVKILIKDSIKKFILKGETVKKTEQRVRLEVLTKLINPLRYIKTCQEEIKKELSKQRPSKKNINIILTSYMTTLINIGVSKQHLYEQTRNFFFFGNEIESIEELDTYFYNISPTTHHFEIYFIVSNLIKEAEVSLEVFDIEILNNLPSPASEIAVANNMEKQENEVWVEIKDIETFDAHRARNKAEITLDRVRDLLLLFSHKNRLNWRREAIITQCCIEQPTIIKIPKNPMEKCFDLRTQEASKRLNKLIRNMSLEGESFIKFHRVIDLHGIASTNDLSESQLLNVWIALETLIPSTVHGGGKVVKICNAITPILLRNYLNRIVERFAADLILWSRSKTNNILRKLSNSDGKKLYQKILEILAIESNKHLRDEFYTAFDNFYLLRFRMFELSELFKEPSKLIDRLNLHEQKVQWQIRRIYRTRNLIVHSGDTLSYIDTLIENAHDYLDQSINMVINNTCGVLQTNSIEQAFDVSKIEYEYFLQSLKNIIKFDEENISHILLNN